MESQVDGVDGVCIARDSRFDGEWHLELQGLLASYLLINGDSDWLDCAARLGYLGSKLASLLPWPVGIVEHLDLNEVGGASSDLDHAFRLLLYDGSLFVEGLVQGLSIRPASPFLGLNEELVFRRSNVGGEGLNKLSEDLPLLFLLGGGASLHRSSESFLHFSALLFASLCVDESLDLEHIIENSSRLLPWLLRSAFLGDLFFLLLAVVLSFLPALLGRLGLALSARLLFASSLSGEVVVGLK